MKLIDLVNKVEAMFFNYASNPMEEELCPCCFVPTTRMSTRRMRTRRMRTTRIPTTRNNWGLIQRKPENLDILGNNVRGMDDFIKITEEQKEEWLNKAYEENPEIKVHQENYEAAVKRGIIAYGYEEEYGTDNERYFLTVPHEIHEDLIIIPSLIEVDQPKGKFLHYDTGEARELDKEYHINFIFIIEGDRYFDGPHIIKSDDFLHFYYLISPFSECVSERVDTEVKEMKVDEVLWK